MSALAVPSPSFAATPEVDLGHPSHLARPSVLLSDGDDYQGKLEDGRGVDFDYSHVKKEDKEDISISCQ